VASHSANPAWLPSQFGDPPVCLHMHQATVAFSVTSYFTGENSVPLWLPSQNGWVAELPQEHQK